MAETMHIRVTKVTLLNYTIIVREKTDAVSMGPNHAITIALRSAVGDVDENGVRLKPDAIANALNAMPDVVAYEILDVRGDGAMVLKEPK